MVYSWGDSNGWPDFDVSKATKWQQRILEDNWLPMSDYTPAPPTVEIPPVIIPYDWTRAQHKELKKVNVRAAQALNAPIMGGLKMNTPFWVILSPNNEDWYVVQFGTGIGFVHKDALTLWPGT